jgi:hypothetical protein
MTKEQFLKMEKLCKDGWKEVAANKLSTKPASLREFSRSCPACEIAILTDNKVTVCECIYCPVTRWRKRSYPLGNKTACEHGEAYGRWYAGGELCGFGADAAVEAALEISELEWSWIPEYDFIELSDGVLKILEAVHLDTPPI